MEPYLEPVLDHLPDNWRFVLHDRFCTHRILDRRILRRAGGQGGVPVAIDIEIFIIDRRWIRAKEIVNDSFGFAACGIKRLPSFVLFIRCILVIVKKSETRASEIVDCQPGGPRCSVKLNNHFKIAETRLVDRYVEDLARAAALDVVLRVTAPACR